MLDSSDLRSRICPICEQYVSEDLEAYVVKVSPAFSIIIHKGCGLSIKETIDKTEGKG
jgi:hypothetical protein